MSSSTIISKPIELSDSHLFYGNRTYLRRHEERFARIVPRGASHQDQGAKPGDMIFTKFSGGKAYDHAAYYRPANKQDRRFADVSGSKDKDESLFDPASSRFVVDTGARTLRPTTQGTEGLLFACEWLRNIDTVAGQPYPDDQVKDLGMNTVGLGLIDSKPDPDGRHRERMSVYKLSSASEDSTNATSEEELLATITCCL